MSARMKPMTERHALMLEGARMMHKEADLKFKLRRFELRWIKTKIRSERVKNRELAQTLNYTAEKYLNRVNQIRHELDMEPIRIWR